MPRAWSAWPGRSSTAVWSSGGLHARGARLPRPGPGRRGGEGRGDHARRGAERAPRRWFRRIGGQRGVDPHRGRVIDPITEERPGTYVFGDRQHANLGGSDPSSLALVVAATVVSTSVDGRCVLDSGAEALAKDKPGWLAGHGVVPQLPGAVIQSVYDHHAVLDLPPDLPPPRLGDIVTVVPNHACPVVNLTDELVLTRGGQLVETIPVLARGRNR